MDTEQYRASISKLKAVAAFEPFVEHMWNAHKDVESKLSKHLELVADLDAKAVACLRNALVVVAVKDTLPTRDDRSVTWHVGRGPLHVLQIEDMLRAKLNKVSPELVPSRNNTRQSQDCQNGVLLPFGDPPSDEDLSDEAMPLVHIGSRWKDDLPHILESIHLICLYQGKRLWAHEIPECGDHMVKKNSTKQMDVKTTADSGTKVRAQESAKKRQSPDEHKNAE